MRRPDRFLAPFCMAALLLAVMLSPVMRTVQAQDDRGYKVRVGDPVPDFSLLDLEGASWSRQDLLGSIYILQFTASWCGVCRKEMPHLEERVWQRFKGTGFQMLGVDLDEPAAKVAGLVEDTGISYPVCLDEGGELFSRITVPKAGVTRNVVVDREGNIAFLTRLFDETEFEAMIAAVGKLLEDQE